MPIYEYECVVCHTRFERRQGIHDAPVKECPDCQGGARRVFHPVGIIFKGSGFYITDSRKSEAASIGGNGSASDEKGEKVETTVKAEAKPEAKASAAKSDE
ncbi:MAG: zinc ribbon domain-containing protein [Chloroflexi bacterium]|nr:zinc ribbon domain-containing protein [Chloroflexota bacterium]